jgi:hypothetical protein
VHTYLLAEAGIPIMEIVNLEELAGEKKSTHLRFLWRVHQTTWRDWFTYEASRNASQEVELKISHLTAVAVWRLCIEARNFRVS